MENNKDFNERTKATKMDNQRLYKNYLDQQTEINKDNHHNEDSNFEQLIMPGYTYLNRPIATNKKAKDSIELVKNNALFDANLKPMDKFFSWEAQYETMIDYGKHFLKV